MKHFYISIIIFITIVSGSIFSNTICSHILGELYNSVSVFRNIVYNDLNTETNINKISEIFYSKKNMLQLFINKEHIEEIEINICLLKNAVDNRDYEDCQQKSIEILTMLSFLDDSLTASD